MKQEFVKNDSGFTLIELMIVTSIIVIIAAIAIPALLRAKLTANESSAIGSLRTLANSETTFQAGTATDADTDGIGEYGSLAQMTNAVPAFIDDSLGSGQKSGYSFVVTTTGTANIDETMWCATAFPTAKGQTGNRTFYIDESSVLRASDMGGATGAPGIPATRATASPAAGGNYPSIK